MYRVPNSKQNEIQFSKLIKIHSFFGYIQLKPNRWDINKSQIVDNFIDKSSAVNSSLKTKYDKNMGEIMNSFHFMFSVK